MHLVRFPDGASVRDYAPLVVGYPNAATAATLLFERGLIEDAALARIKSTIPPGKPTIGTGQRVDRFFTPSGLHR